MKNGKNIEKQLRTVKNSGTGEKQVKNAQNGKN
jgi:hypothetical protein